MDQPRIELAVRRIESALGRIADLADRIDPAPASTPPSVAGSGDNPENLRDAVSNSLKELDDLIERLER